MVQHSILIIDDDADIRNALQLVLKKAGFHPLLAESGQAAIALMEQDEQAADVAAILCDLEMPGMNGATVIAHFQRHHPMIPVLVLSGAAPAQFLDAVGQQGVGDWIRKPATNETVLEKVRGAISATGTQRAPRPRIGFSSKRSSSSATLKAPVAGSRGRATGRSTLARRP